MRSTMRSAMVMGVPSSRVPMGASILEGRPAGIGGESSESVELRSIYQGVCREHSIYQVFCDRHAGRSLVFGVGAGGGAIWGVLDGSSRGMEVFDGSSRGMERLPPVLRCPFRSIYQGVCSRGRW